jgi:hypothetical protein
MGRGKLSPEEAAHVMMRLRRDRFMSKIRINDLARELEVKSLLILLCPA